MVSYSSIVSCLFVSISSAGTWLYHYETKLKLLLNPEHALDSSYVVKFVVYKLLSATESNDSKWVMIESKTCQLAEEVVV